jgi:peptidoglycan/LPS O-acetylase OafA/YrhL
MAHLATGDPSRAYFGTDTRVHSLLVGALLALALERRHIFPTGVGGRILRGTGALALVAVIAAYVTIGDGRLFMYRGGFLVFALAVVAVITAAVQPRGPVRALLSLAPLVWIGTISYGLYLWHWPVQLVLTPNRTHLDGVTLDLARVAVTVACATISYFAVELPIRRGVALRGRIALPSAVAVAGGLAAVLVIATAATTPAPAFATPVAGAPITILASRAVPPQRTTAHEPATTAISHAPRLIGVIGDSVAMSLIPGLEVQASPRGISVASAAIPGCGATDAFSLDSAGNPFSWSDDCVTAVPELQAQLITEFRPDVVLWLSSWETSDRLVAGRAVHFGTPEGDAALLRGMTATLDRVTAGGAHLVMLTLPPRGQRQDGRTVRDDPAAIDHLDELIMDFAFAHADQVQLIDFANIVCHGGAPCPNEIDGMWMRPDGMHFTDETSVWPAARLLDILLATPQ